MTTGELFPVHVSKVPQAFDNSLDLYEQMTAVIAFLNQIVDNFNSLNTTQGDLTTIAEVVNTLNDSLGNLQKQPGKRSLTHEPGGDFGKLVGQRYLGGYPHHGIIGQQSQRDRPEPRCKDSSTDLENRGGHATGNDRNRGKPKFVRLPNTRLQTT